ncbi:MAG TPA: hypothetical protein VEQ59_20105, partial [Polyangiaceae bacterium]|nr:hypothetical protein [Polyangiaceae bacterium]
AFNLPQITAASEHGAIYLSSTAGALNVAAALTEPNVPVKAIFRIDGNVVGEQSATAAAADATKMTAAVPSSMLKSGAKYEAELMQDDKSLIKGQITLN